MNLRLVREHCVEVDPKASGAVHAFFAFPIEETASPACFAALLVRMHDRLCDLFGPISYPVSWHRWNTFFSCTWTVVTAVIDHFVFYLGLFGVIICKCK